MQFNTASFFMADFFKISPSTQLFNKPGNAPQKRPSLVKIAEHALYAWFFLSFLFGFNMEKH